MVGFGDNLKDHTAQRHREKKQGRREKAGNHRLHHVPHSTPERGMIVISVLQPRILR